jgi:hypothetical protein
LAARALQRSSAIYALVTSDQSSSSSGFRVRINHQPATFFADPSTVLEAIDDVSDGEYSHVRCDEQWYDVRESPSELNELLDNGEGDLVVLTRMSDGLPMWFRASHIDFVEGAAGEDYMSDFELWELMHSVRYPRPMPFSRRGVQDLRCRDAGETCRPRGRWSRRPA